MNTMNPEILNEIQKQSCMDCNAHKVISDPDPDDWFCNDDVAVICTLEKNDIKNIDSKYVSDWSDFKCIQVGIRPYRVRKETDIPSWCPKKRNV